MTKKLSYGNIKQKKGKNIFTPYFKKSDFGFWGGAFTWPKNSYLKLCPAWNSTDSWCALSSRNPRQRRDRRTKKALHCTNLREEEKRTKLMPEKSFSIKVRRPSWHVSVEVWIPVLYTVGLYRVFQRNSVCFELLVWPGFWNLGQLIVLFGVLSGGNLTYDPLIWSKVTSLFSTASKRKGVKNICKKEFECT